MLYNAPVAEDQINVWNRFRPTKSQEKFLRSTATGRLFSSGYGSGKSSVGCRESIAWALKYPGSRNLVARLEAVDLRDTTMVTFWAQMNKIGLKQEIHYEYNRSDKILEWKNGSVTIFRNLDDPESLGSLELTSAFIDEGSEVDDIIYKTISSSRLRWHIPGCDQQDTVSKLIELDATDEQIAAVPCTCPHGIWVCTNPGGSGYLREVTKNKVDGWEWIRAAPGDNPYNPPDFYAKMERDRKVNGDVWMKRYYEGDWSAFQGQRFTMLDRDKHVLDKPFVPTDKHLIIEGWDFGHRETFVTWIAYDPKGVEPNVVFEELQVQEVQEPSDVADPVKEIRKRYGFKRVIALGDPAGAGASQFSAVSPLTAYAGLGIMIAPCRAGVNPQERANIIATFLTDERKQPDGTVWPGLVFGPNCPEVFESLTNLRWKEIRSRVGEDGREVFLKKADHGADSLGYGLVGVPLPRTPKPKPRSFAGNQPIEAIMAEREGKSWN